MCGLLFSSSDPSFLSRAQLSSALDKMSWRGPDAGHYDIVNFDWVFLGHRRLSIIDPRPESDQPMLSRSGRYSILFNGEIYNYKSIREALNLECKTSSDTEVILEGYELIGEEIFSKIDGMFSIVIYDRRSNQWICARDRFGIKPLYIHQSNRKTIICSEASPINDLIGSAVDYDAISEWESFRRPMPGYSFFKDIKEVLPGTILKSDGSTTRYYNLINHEKQFKQEEFEFLLLNSIEMHQQSDVDVVSLLSGGLDSAVITAGSTVQKSYTVGSHADNEFEGAGETAEKLGRNCIYIEVNQAELVSTWKRLTRLKGEPISLPNEGLIYHVCSNMPTHEKVVLTGEGADELLFGYDNIYRWANASTSINASDFLCKYGYSENVKITQRFMDYVEDLNFGKSPIQFVEDFFIMFHLPGLLRRMDFSSMAASKEARVPFVSKDLIEYMYRQDIKIKLSDVESKIPLRCFAEKIGLNGALNRRKIGFSAKVNDNMSHRQQYKLFQSIILEELKW